MADAIDVLLTLGYDTGISEELHEYLTSPILGIYNRDGSESGQYLTCISSEEIYPHDYPGSSQAGVLRVYAACLRRGYETSVMTFLRNAPWKYESGIVVISGHDGPPTIAQVYGGM